MTTLMFRPKNTFSTSHSGGVTGLEKMDTSIRWYDRNGIRQFNIQRLLDAGAKAVEVVLLVCLCKKMAAIIVGDEKQKVSLSGRQRGAN